MDDPQVFTVAASLLPHLVSAAMGTAHLVLRDGEPPTLVMSLHPDVAVKAVGQLTQLTRHLPPLTLPRFRWRATG